MWVVLCILVFNGDYCVLVCVKGVGLSGVIIGGWIGLVEKCLYLGQKRLLLFNFFYNSSHSQFCSDLKSALLCLSLFGVDKIEDQMSVEADCISLSFLVKFLAY